jgi:hypothetical protein
MLTPWFWFWSWYNPEECNLALCGLNDDTVAGEWDLASMVMTIWKLFYIPLEGDLAHHKDSVGNAETITTGSPSHECWGRNSSQ